MAKYKVQKSDLPHLYKIIDMQMQGNYHGYYENFGVVKGGNGNFECVNQAGHSGGIDNKPSLSINEDTGQGFCHTCRVKFNAPTFYKEYVSGSGNDMWDGSYTSFMIDFLGLTQFVKFTDSKGVDIKTDKQVKEIKDMEEFCNDMQRIYKSETGSSYVQPDEVRDNIKKEISIDKSINDKFVEALLADDTKLKYLRDSRNIDENTITKYRIGINGKGFTFPVINGAGDITNIKQYNPFNPEWKWTYHTKGGTVSPTPINNFTHRKLYFFEGEPDMYCACGFGIDSPVTMGAASNCDVLRKFNTKQCQQLFGGKEIVLCLDSDAAGIEGANKLAKSLLPYAKQIKIINFDKSKSNPLGLDPGKMKDVGGKSKRSETDFTDFMKKNGFSQNAMTIFSDLERDTDVYYDMTDRARSKEYNVSLDEAYRSKYYSHKGNIKLNIIASVSEADPSTYKIPSEFVVNCPSIAAGESNGKMCAGCMVPDMPGFGDDETRDEGITCKIQTHSSEDDLHDPSVIRVSEHDLLGLIDATNSQKISQQKRIAKIKGSCSIVDIVDSKVSNVMYASLTRSVGELAETEYRSDSEKNSNPDARMGIYMMHERMLMPNKTYKFKAIQTTTWDNQRTVLFAYDVEPLFTSIETFELTDEIDDALQVFKLKDGETIKQHLKRRYKIFGAAAGLCDRDDLFLLNDFVYFSTLELDKTLVSVKRGWVEVLIAGDTRCGKSLASRFCHSHYKVGEVLTSAASTSFPGLVGGVDRVNNGDSNLRWGKVVTNDGGMLTIDEMSDMHPKLLNDITAIRSEGVAEVNKSRSGKADARVRKVMLSNDRGWNSSNVETFQYGIDRLLSVATRDRVLSRFDVAYVVRASDVKKIDSVYAEITTEFNEFQCQNLIKYAHSRSIDQIIYEDGFMKEVARAQDDMLKIYHQDLHLINQETRAKLVRLSVSLATMLYSHKDGDRDRIYVKKEHLYYVRDFLYETYSSENIMLDTKSKIEFDREHLGDMGFMDAMLEHSDALNIANSSSFSMQNIATYFDQYLIRVMNGSMYMISPDDKGRMTHGRKQDLMGTLIGVLQMRNCIRPGNGGRYSKTAVFAKWLTRREADIVKKLKRGSSILTVRQNESLLKQSQELAELAGAVSELKRR